MRRFYRYDHVRDLYRATAVAIGVFDGIHLGHQALLKRLLSLPGDLAKLVMTFDPHPGVVLGRATRPGRIMSLEHRLNIFEKMDLDGVVIVDFDRDFARMNPEQFTSKVLTGMNVRKVFVGKGFRFGSARSGDVDVLSRLGREQGIEVNVVENVRLAGRIVSSTNVRELVTSGELSLAASLLGRPVSVLGTVVPGRQKGRQLGLPTANIDPHQEVMPPRGVYAVKADISGRLWDGVLNVGFNPTFFSEAGRERKEPNVELHVLGFSGDLYDQAVEIFFIERLREEKRFSDEKALKEAIKRDITKARVVLKKKNVERSIQLFPCEMSGAGYEG